MPDIKQIAERLIKLCSEQKFVEAYRELFGEEVESIDPLYPIMPPARGLITLIEREKQFLAKAQIHSITMSEPLITGNHFAVKLSMDFTHEERGRINMEELCVYHVKGGKIMSQQFFIN
ncbi:SnoaL-like domain-containing protein [Mucilaginibacter ginsenosidivorans]|uniref:Nuclear transport factor 2 family protein n=1 Tax=Mucilaginibacter ginsenosidivorans TaxID=398053 RepID=A0A5B8V0M9_9SPHI|nr:SnoaL-like domain-containing protein [Mucilaginibacter ginsenosidivorans]QEC64904.1 nuclear transport factor 2 family protein [Mucilaginibacter ginsenosidivorans]